MKSGRLSWEELLFQRFASAVIIEGLRACQVFHSRLIGIAAAVAPGSCPSV